MSMYKPEIQKLYVYFAFRIEQNLKQINEERLAEGESTFTLSVSEIDELAQDLLNYVTDTEEFDTFVTTSILEKVRIDIGDDVSE